MTTTDFDDQFTAAPEHVTHQPYDVTAILRQNVADLEMQVQKQRERHAAATERLRDQVERVTSEWERAEAELKELREQEPVAWMLECQQWTGDTAWLLSWSKSGAGQCNRIEGESHQRALYTRPIPAPVVDVGAGKLAANAADTKHQSHVTRSSDSSSYDEKCLNCGATDSAGGGWGELANPCPAPAVPAPEIPDGDAFNGTTLHLIQCIESLVRMNDCGALVPHGIGGHARTLLLASANRLRQQPAPAVPAEWREVMAELAADLQAYIDTEHAYRDQYAFVMRKYQNDMRIVERARALLQSAAPAPAVPEEWPAMLRTCRFIRREAWNPEAFIWFQPGDEKNHSTVMLHTHGKVHAGWIGVHCDHHARDWVYCDDMARALLQSTTTGETK